MNEETSRDRFFFEGTGREGRLTVDVPLPPDDLRRLSEIEAEAAALARTGGRVTADMKRRAYALINEGFEAGEPISPGLMWLVARVCGVGRDKSARQPHYEHTAGDWYAAIEAEIDVPPKKGKKTPSAYAVANAVWPQYPKLREDPSRFDRNGEPTEATFEDRKNQIERWRKKPQYRKAIENRRRVKALRALQETLRKERKARNRETALARIDEALAASGTGNDEGATS